MKRVTIGTLVLTLFTFFSFLIVNYNTITIDTETQISYIEEDSQEEYSLLTAQAEIESEPEVLEYSEENDTLRAFAGLKTYVNEEIAFEYANSWVEVQDVEEIKDPTFLINGRNAVFNIVKEDIPEKFTMDDYIKSTKKVLEKENNINIIYSEPTTINNIEGFNLVYTIEDESIKLINQFCAIKNGKVYIFSYYADETDYDRYFQEFLDLLLTLTINEI